MNDIETFLSHIFIFIDDFCKQVFPKLFAGKAGAKSEFSDSEVITFALAQESLSFCSQPRFYGLFKKNFLYLFPKLIDRTQVNRRIKSLQYAIELIRRHLLGLLGITGSEDRVVDSTPIPVVHFKRAHFTPLFKGKADYGYCATKNETY